MPPQAQSQEGEFVPQNSREAQDCGSGTRSQFPWKIALPVSLLLLLPCFWQSRIQSIDLYSHIYNAWLASLIAHNQAPGLWLSHQSNNVLFDLILAWLLPHFGAAATQRIAVGATVLIFSWGAILFISRGRPRNWWFLLPSVAVLSYGFIFNAGFFNFYLALGICFWYLAFFLSGGWRRRCLLTPLLLLAWIAHPIPVLWAAGLALYATVAELLPEQGRGALLAVGLVVLLEAHFLIVSRYQCFWSINQAWYATGAKQLLLFGRLYVIPYWLLLAAWVLLFWRRVRAFRWRNVLVDLNFHLWLLTAAAIALIPSVILLPQYAVALSFVSARLSLAAAIALGAFLIEVRPNGYERAILALSAVIYFGLVFHDARKLNRLEDKVDAAVAQLPVNSRVIGLLRVPSQAMTPGVHGLDRACIGHCFSYANYEPASQAFRLRASAGNPIVMADYRDVQAAEIGQYQVQARDLPVFLVYLCGPDGQQVCSRNLHEGEVIGSAGGSD